MILFLKQLGVFLVLVGAVFGSIWGVLWLFSKDWAWIAMAVALLLLFLLCLWAVAGQIVSE